MQKHTFAGNLTKAAVLRTNNDRDSLSFILAANEGSNQNTGEQYVTYMPVVVSGPKGFADNIKEFLVKGKGVTVRGESYVTRNEEGENVYDNPGIRLRSLRNGLSLSGEAAAVSPSAVNEAQSPVSQDEQEANEKQAQMADEVLNEAPGAFDQADDDIPF